MLEQCHRMFQGTKHSIQNCQMTPGIEILKVRVKCLPKYYTGLVRFPEKLYDIVRCCHYKKNQFRSKYSNGAVNLIESTVNIT